MSTKKKTTAKPKNENKPKAIYFTTNMAKDLARIRRVRDDSRISDSVLIADAMQHYREHLENPTGA
jgi:hypothetical protein